MGSDDLPLNISREILQEDPITRIIRRSTQRKVFSELKKMLENDREKYERFWNAFGRILKEGVIQDRGHAATILGLALFHTTAQEGATTLEEYRKRMQPEQKGIYCLTGRSLSALKASPKLEPFAAKGLEVLLMTDPVDEVILAEGAETDSVKLLNAGLDADVPESGEEKERREEELKGMEADFAPLKDQAMAAMSDRLQEVRPSLSLTSSPACLRDANGLSFQMEQLMRAMGQTPPAQKRVLELNVGHPLIKRLMELAKQKAPETADLLSILYDQSLILEGVPVEDPASFVRRVNEVMARLLKA